MRNDRKKVKKINFLDGIEREFALDTFPKGKTLKIDDISFKVVKNNGVGIYLRPTDEGRVPYGREDRDKMTTRFIQGNEILEESLYRDVEELLDLPISELDIYAGTLNPLMVAEFKSIRDITKCTKNDLLKFRRFGRKALEDLQKRLHAKGLKLAE